MEKKGVSIQAMSSFLALVISVAALFVSIYEANLLRAQEKMMIWPYVEVGPSYSSDGFNIVVNNEGIGPAIIRSIEVSYNGQKFQSWEELLDHIKPGYKIDYGTSGMSNINGRVIRPGNQIRALHLPWNEETRFIAGQLANFKVKVCYCSVADNCWIFDITTKDRIEKKVDFKEPFLD